jgi:hypothetical protein
MLRGLPPDDVAIVFVEIQDRDVAEAQALNSREHGWDQLAANVISLVLES